MNEAQAAKIVLIIDDEEINRIVIAGFVEEFGYEARTADSGLQGLEMLGPEIDAVLLDVMMPEMDGFEVARKIRALGGYEDLPLLMITALTEKQDRLEAVKAGANDFISKPIDGIELATRLDAHLRLKSFHDEVKHYQLGLERLVAERTMALEEAQAAKLKAHLETLFRLSTAAEYKDEETARHIDRMRHYSALLAQYIGLSEYEVDLILQASAMHDIGKIGIPDSILLKPGRLDAAEWSIMRTHTVIGGSILDSASSDYLETGRVIALTHHEKWDGSGYPQGLVGEDIPLFGRLSAIADVFDALTTKRPYKEPYSNAKALDIMREGRGSHFDPDLLDMFLKHFDEIEEIQKRFRD